MQWKIREEKTDEAPPCYLTADGSSDFFTVEIHHGGKLVGDNEKAYVGGKFDYVDYCDVDLMSIIEVHEMLSELGHKENMDVYYLRPDAGLNTGLLELKSDADVLELCKWAQKNKVMKVYCTPQGIDDNRPDIQHQQQSVAGLEDFNDLMDAIINGQASEVIESAMLDEDRQVNGQVAVCGDIDRHEEAINIDIQDGIRDGAVRDGDDAGEVDAGVTQIERIGKKVPKNVGQHKLKKKKPFAQHGEWGEGQRRQTDIEMRPRVKATVDAQTEIHMNVDGDGDIMENMLDDELRSLADSSEDDEDVQPNMQRKRHDKKSMPPDFYIGLRFADAEEFRNAVNNYSICTGKPVRFTTNEAKRLRAKCKPPCNWFVYASTIESEGSQDLVVKTLLDEHDGCMHTFKNRNVTAKWLAERYQERIRSNMHLPIRELRQTVFEEYGVEITKPQAYRARRIAIEQINGSDAEQYAKIFNYCAEIKRTHPNSTMEVMFTPFREEVLISSYMQVRRKRLEPVVSSVPQPSDSVLQSQIRRVASSSSAPQEIMAAETPVFGPQHNKQAQPSSSTKAPGTASRKTVATSRKHPLTNADKNAINWHYSWMGKEPPYQVGNWPMRTRASQPRGGRGRGRKPSKS